MGIDFASASQLAEASKWPRPEGEMLMLGRQRMYIRPRHLRRLNDVFVSHGFDVREDVLRPTDIFAEPFLNAIGFDNVVSMDAVPYESADIVHDLNEPLPKALKNRFSMIFDGGTLEHIFNMPQALHNVHDMLKPDGVFISATPGDGFFGHGFWQTSPELVFSYWGTSRGYEVVSCMELPVLPRFAPRVVPDPRTTGKRASKAHDGVQCYLFYAVRRPKRARKYTTPQQSDYVSMWTKSTEDDEQG